MALNESASSFFAGLAGPGRGVSINPKARAKAAQDSDDDDEWESSSEGSDKEINDAEELEKDNDEEPDNDADEDEVPDDEEDEEDVVEGLEQGEEDAEEEDEDEDDQGEEDEEDEEGDEDDKADTQPRKKAKVQGAIEGAETVTIEEGQEQSKTSWLDLPLSKPLQKAIASNGWITPTPVQCKAIPAAMEGYDICCRAVTGSGKTGAFLLPIISRSMNTQGRLGIFALVVLPTRELAVQCYNMLEQLTQTITVTKSLVIGGLSPQAQMRELRNRPDVVVCTPGRMIDCLRNAQGVSLDQLEILVLDEADKLLSLGFREQIEEMLRFCPKQRQTMLLSATMTKEVNELAALSLTRPINVDVGHVAVATNLIQEFIRMPKEKEDRAKDAHIACLCTNEFTRGVIIFCHTKARAQRLKITLDLLGIKAAELHQNIKQTDRLEALEMFRNKQVKVLVTTEVAARGLDIPNVRTVINYDLPKDITGYVHRVGRTARIGNKGRAVSLINTNDIPLLKKVIKLSKSTATSKVRRREVEEERLEEAGKKLEGLQSRVQERLKEGIMEREVNEAERKVQKMQNTVKYMDEIKGRPKNTWFQSEREKKATKKRAREDEETKSKKDLDDFLLGQTVHALPRKKANPPGSKAERLEKKLKNQAADPLIARQRAVDAKYGKSYQPPVQQKMRGKSTKKANASQYVKKRKEAKEAKIEKAKKFAGKRAGKKAKDNKKSWDFKERKGVSFKSKKRYKRH